MQIQLTLSYLVLEKFSMEKQKRKFVTPVHKSKFILGSVTRQVSRHGQNTASRKKKNGRHGGNENKLLDIRIFLSFLQCRKIADLSLGMTWCIKITSRVPRTEKPVLKNQNGVISILCVKKLKSNIAKLLSW